MLIVEEVLYQLAGMYMVILLMNYLKLEIKSRSDQETLFKPGITDLADLLFRLRVHPGSSPGITDITPA